MFRDGIYFGLSNEAYHADPALGSTDLKGLLVNPVQWHFANRNPAVRELFGDDDEAKKVSAAKRFGNALHCIVLEPDEFDRRYCVAAENPGHPKTKEEMAIALANIGQTPPKSGEKRDSFVAACRMYGVETHDDWVQEELLRTEGREVISPRWWHGLQLLRRALEKHSEAGKFVRKGYAEVSMFWTDEDGVRLKVRFDYLRVRTVADVKSYALYDGTDPVECFVSAMTRFAYDFSAVHYMHARREILPGLVERGAIYNAAEASGEPTPEHLKFVQEVAAFAEPSWWWITCMTQGAPEVDALKFPESILGYVAAQSQVEIAKARYKEFRERFGEDDSNMWVADRGLIQLTDYNFSARATGRGEAKYEAV